jgi:hypothetical protein
MTIALGNAFGKDDVFEKEKSKRHPMTFESESRSPKYHGPPQFGTVEDHVFTIANMRDEARSL